MKAEYKKLIRAYFYKHVDEAGRNTRENKKTFFCKENIPWTLEAMGAARESADIVTTGKGCAEG